MEFQKRRWISLIAGVLIELLSGVAYAWSVFQTPLIERFGWTVSQVSMAYTIYFFVIMLMSLFCGAKLKQKLKIKTEVLIGAVGYGGGILLMGFMRGSIWELYLFFGLISSVGTALIYPVLISYALELFPERTGFAGGLMTAGYGLGAVIWAPLASVITQRTGNIGTAFLVMGVLFTVGIVLLSRLLESPPEGFREEMMRQKASRGEKAGKPMTSLYDVDKRGMIRLPVFYAILLSLLIGLACGNMIITQGAPILQLRFGMAATATAVVVSFLSVTNTVGRLAWGAFSDRAGKVNALILVHLCTAVFMVLLLALKRPGAFIAVLLGTTFCYGGVACLVAPSTEELFGGKHISENYSVTYSTFGISSLIGPVLISNIRQTTGDYTMGFAAAVAMACVGMALAVAVAVKARHVRAAGQAGVSTPSLP